ncbi:MAG: enoyl-CoA hydratase, partial [Pseudonocardia sp.]|nr:enoyl-CoA hydratase [Pseudonocardia sp.]
MTDQLDVERDGAVLRVTFNRPEAHNALTFAMYQGLYDACETADADDGIRALVLRGAGGNAFVSGSVFAVFVGFDGGEVVEFVVGLIVVVRLLEVTAVR